MAITDRIKELTRKAQGTAAEHKEQINQAVEKAEVAADQRTSGRYHDQIANAAAKVETYVGGLEPEAAEQAKPADDAPDATHPPEKPER